MSANYFRLLFRSDENTETLEFFELFSASEGKNVYRTAFEGGKLKNLGSEPIMLLREKWRQNERIGRAKKLLEQQVDF